MKKLKNVTYAVHPDGYVVSRSGREMLWPILQYAEMGPHNNYEPVYTWEKVGVFEVSSDEWNSLRWTRKIPTEIKNFHRQHWGLKPLRIVETVER